MYISSLTYNNLGPLRNLDVALSFDEKGFPKPLFVVGENGSGKSLFISNIVDALVEAASVAFDNVRPPIRGGASQYFKVIRPIEVRLGEEYLAVHIRFSNDEEYVFKSGQAEYSALRESLHIGSDSLNWADSSNFKKTTFSKEKAEEAFANCVVCYFGPNRYEQPSWMGDLYLESPRKDSDISVFPHYADTLENPIFVQHCIADTQSWLLNVIADSRTDIVTRCQDGETLYEAAYDVLSAKEPSRRTLAFVERVLSVVLEEDVFLYLNNRGSGEGRLSIRSRVDKRVISPSFNSLSTGQLALFELFTTILRYADHNQMNSGAKPGSIEGIVVIDEADLHLHTTL